MAIDCDDANELAGKIWEALNEKNKVALYTRVIDLATGDVEEAVINKYDAVVEE